MRLRVLTYNMHKGFCFYSRQYVLHELRHAIRAVDADLVFLQEVMGVHPPNHGVELDIDSQFEFLADDIWSHFAYGKNAIYSDGHHGNAILSKYPIVEFDNINVSTNPLEQRGLLHARIDLPDRPLDVVCLHLDLLDRGRKQQMNRLIQHVKAEVESESALIIAGDFNDWQKKFSDPLGAALGVKETGVLHTGEHSPTFPSWKPFLTLDRIYIRGFRVHSYQVLYGLPWRRMSDHAAIVAEIEMLPVKSSVAAGG
jgi:endonuclease/exonuclease/phosphatase family metal-dependent hydrolase